MPIDRIVHVEIMATETISADLPEVNDWKKQADKIIYQRYGIEVEHIRSQKTFEQLFFSIPKRKKCNADKQGTIRGFPSLRSQWCSRELKADVMTKTNRKNVQYIGIAADEHKRHSQLNSHIRSPLVEHNVTEAECLQICSEIGLLAPTYLQSKRSGCWFCPAQPTEQLRLLRKQHPELWKKLLEWDSFTTIPFRHAGIGKREVSVADFDKRFELEELGILDKNTSNFRWSKLYFYEKQLMFQEF